MFQLEQTRVPYLHHDCRERKLGEPLHLECERPVQECGGEVLQALSLDRSEDGSVFYVLPVVPAGQGRADGPGPLGAKRYG